MKKGTAVATGGSTRCDRNQIVRSLFLMRLKRKRASAYAAGRPRASAISTEQTEMIRLLPKALWASGVESWEIQFSSVGVKSMKGMPRPATVKVSAGARRLLETAQ